jgi:hypothetical protein
LLFAVQDPGADTVHAAQLTEKAFPQRTPDAVIVYRDEDRTVDDSRPSGGRSSGRGSPCRSRR